MVQDLEKPVRNTNFVIRDDEEDGEYGLFAVDDAGDETRISDPIWHLGNASRADGSSSSDVIRFRDRDRKFAEIIIPHKDSIIETRKMFYALADKKFAVPTSKERRDQLASYLGERRQSPDKTFLLAERMGWHGSSFVIGRDVISTDRSKGIKHDGPITKYAVKFGKDGTLDGHQTKILRRASYSSRLMAGVAMALLAPLTRIMSLGNGGLSFIGINGTGKTTISRVAGLFYGGGPVDYFVPWDMTDNAPETLGLAFCDLPLLLDETGTLETDASKAGGRLKGIVYRLAMGQGKARSHHASTDDSVSTDFHVLSGSTSEHSLPDFMFEGGSKMTGGQAARFVDIPADAGSGFKIFESLPLVSKTRKRFDVDRYLVLINKACKRHYGVTGRRYLRMLVHELRPIGAP
jgi:putative DNA primase/helicase